MAKKSRLNIGMICAGVAAVLGLVAFFMMFVPALTAKVSGSLIGDVTLTEWSGASIAFGSEDNGLAASAYIIGYILVIVGVVGAVVAALGKGGKIIPLIAAVCLLVAGIFFFLPSALVLPDTGELSGDAKDKAIERFRELVKEMELGAGAIVGGILSIVAALAAAVPVFIKK